MEKREELRVRTRDTLGKKVRFLRRQGFTPANLYAPKAESIALQVDTPLLERLIAKVGRNALVTLRLDASKKPRPAMIRSIQRDPLTGSLLHVDFFQVELTHRLRADIPLIFIGESPAAKRSNAMLIQNLTALHVEGLPTDLPRGIEVDLSALTEVDQAIHVRDIQLDDSLDILNDAELIVAHVVETRVAVEAEAAVEAEIPEAVPAEAEGETE